MTAPIMSSSESVIVRSYDSGGYLIDESLHEINFTLSCLMPCKTCSVPNTSSCTSCYSNTNITINNYFSIRFNSCYNICPNGTYPNDGDFQC